MAAEPAPGAVLGTAYAVLEGGEWHDIHESEWLFGLYRPGEVPTEVALVADPEGPLLGWVDATGGDLDQPVMIQPKEYFGMQFPSGYQAEEEAGRGQAVRLSVRPVRDSEEQAHGR